MDGRIKTTNGVNNHMSKKNNNHANNVLEMPKKCKGEGCSKKDTRFGFCQEHFSWFKEGLITKEGVKVLDFDKKMQALQRRTAKAS